jgi:hypothetical protein
MNLKRRDTNLYVYVYKKGAELVFVVDSGGLKLVKMEGPN